MTSEGAPTWNENFLLKEVQESDTQESRKAETRRLLLEAEEIKAKFPENSEVRKEYEELRHSTILSLQELRVESQEELGVIKQELTQDEKDNLSNGNINEEEFARIQKEFGDLDQVHLNNVSKKLWDTLEQNNLLDKYWPLLSLIGIPNIDTDLIHTVIQDIEENGKLELSTLRKIDDALQEYFDFDSLEEQENIQLVKKALESWDFQTLSETLIPETKKVWVLRSVLENNNKLREKVIFEYDMREYFSWCWPDAIIYIDLITEEYRESRNVIISENLNNYYQNNDINPENLEWLNTLIDSLKSWGCNIDYIAQIQKFNENNWLDVNFTEKDAQAIIGSTIELRKTDNEIAFVSIRDELATITDLSYVKIQNILDSWDATRIWKFLDTYRDDNPQIWEIEAKIFELLDIQRDIDRQEETLNEVSANAEEIYNMTPQERAEYRRLLMSLTGSSINIDISKEVHRNYILADPESRLILMDSADDVISLLPEIDRRDVDIKDVKPEFLSHPRILEYFAQSLMKEEDFYGLPGEIYYSQELCSILAENNENHWEILFYEIMIVQGIDESIPFIYQLIFENSEIFRNENNIEILDNAIPYLVRIRDQEWENILQEIPLHEPENNTPGWFNDTVSAFLEDLNNQNFWTWGWEVSSWTRIASPTQNSMGINNGKGFETSNQNYITELKEYIRNFWISQDIYDWIRALIEAGQVNSVRLILTSLNSENEEELELIMLAIEEYEVNYQFLSPASQSNHKVLQKMWESWISSFDTPLIKNLRSEKLLARYLLWYQTSWSNIDEIYFADDFNLLIDTVENTALEELSEEEREVLQIFWDGMWWKLLERNWYNEIDFEHEEIQEIKKSIRNILSEYGDEEDIEMIFEALDENNTNEFYRRIETLLWWSNLNEEERLWILQEVSNLVLQVRQKESDTADENARDTSLITEEEISELQENRYFENNEFNIDLILEDFQVYAQENLWENELHQIWNRDFIITYLWTLWISHSILERKQEDFITSIQAQARELETQIIRNLVHENPEEAKRLIEDGIWNYAREELYEKIYNWEIFYSQNDTQETKNQTPKNTPKNSEQQTNWLSTTPQGRSIIESWGKTNLILKDWSEIPITSEDAEAIQKSPEAENNVIDAYTYFSETIGMPSIWDYLPEIIKAMNDIWSDIKIDRSDDSINSFEKMKIGKYVLKMIYGKQSETFQMNDEDNYELKLQEYANDWSELVTRKSFWGIWKDKFWFDLDSIWINRELSSPQIVTHFRELAQWDGILNEIDKNNKK